jgi:hypothetical protein
MLADLTQAFVRAERVLSPDVAVQGAAVDPARSLANPPRLTLLVHDRHEVDLLRRRVRAGQFPAQFNTPKDPAMFCADLDDLHLRVLCDEGAELL